MAAAGAIDTAASLRPAPTGVMVEKVSLGEFEAEIVRPVGNDAPLADGAVLYFHGGAFVMGGLNTHRPVVAALARATGRPVMHVAYRQLPTVSIAGSIRDCLIAYKWMLNHGADPASMVFAGDSAGGFLVFATALAARPNGLPLPAGLIGFSPWLDLDCAAKLAHPNRHTDSYLPTSLLAAVSRMGAREPGVADPTPSPVDGDLAGLPPVMLIATDSEVLRVDSEMMSERLIAAAVPCALSIWDGQVHAFPALFPALPESRAALADVADFIEFTSPGNRIADAGELFAE